MNQGITILNDETVSSLAGVASVSSPARRFLGQPVILIQFQANRRRLVDLDSAIEPDTFQSLGSIAVKLIADFSLPRCQMLKRRME